MRLIDADELMRNNLCGACSCNYWDPVFCPNCKYYEVRFMIEAAPTIDADIDRAAILRLCNEIEMIIVTVCDTGYTLQEGDEEAIMKRTKAIRKELAGDAGSKID